MRQSRPLRRVLLLVAAAIAVWGLGWTRQDAPDVRFPRCVLVSTLCPHGANGAANGYSALFRLAALARNFGHLDFELDGQPVALRCAAVRVALPKLCLAGDWRTPNTDAGALFDLRVGRQDDGWGLGGPLWVDEAGALADLGNASVPCLLDGRYMRRRFLPFRANASRAAESYLYTGRGVDYSSDAFGAFSCGSYLAVGYGGLLGSRRGWSAHAVPIVKPRNSDRTFFLGAPAPLRFFPTDDVRGYARPRAVRGDIRFHAWLRDAARELVVRSAGLAGNPPQSWAPPARLPSFTAFLDTRSLPRDAAAAGLSPASLTQLRAIHDCLSPSERPVAPAPAFAAAQFRTGDLGAVCALIWDSPAGRTRPCGANLSALAPVAAKVRRMGLPMVVATDGSDPVRHTISLALPGAVFLDPWLPAACPASPLAYVLRGLLTQLGLACAERVWWTRSSTFSGMIGELAEDGECGTEGRAEPLPGNLPGAGSGAGGVVT
ncbi:hypothetical protein DFJ74DRAFT_706677 [Hyaloraphidium curvatum]|nr:hypothetical protein DFJ74DRAFT_706677 [Hyaloraphidium curvatum]